MGNAPCAERPEGSRSSGMFSLQTFETVRNIGRENKARVHDAGFLPPVFFSLTSDH